MSAEPTALTVPANYEAEEAVLGSLLIDNVAFYEVAPRLAAADFYREKNGWLYQAMLDLWLAGTPVDFVTVVARLEQAGTLQECGGPAYLAGLLNQTPSAVYAAHYAGLVQQAAERRRLLAVASQIAQLAYTTEQPATVVAQGTALLAAAVRGANAEHFLSWDESFGFWNDQQLERAAEHASGKPKLTLPWSCLSFVHPLRGGTLLAVTAASSVGKTAFAENLAEFWARRGFQVLFAHFELSHQVMLDRRMARWSGEPLAVIERGELTAKMQQADDNILTWPGKVHYQECSGWSVGRLVTEARRRRQMGQCDVLILDYFNKASLEIAQGMNVTTARGLMVEALKTFAERERIPVVVLAQLSKEGKRQERKTGADIRDTGEIEDKCNLLITLDRPILNGPLLFGQRTIPAGKRSPHTKVRVDKQTIGDTGEKDLIYIGERFMFVQPQTKGAE